jgi:hypothetical protein
MSEDVVSSSTKPGPEPAAGPEVEAELEGVAASWAAVWVRSSEKSRNLASIASGEMTWDLGRQGNDMLRRCFVVWLRRGRGAQHEEDAGEGV